MTARNPRLAYYARLLGAAGHDEATVLEACAEAAWDGNPGTLDVGALLCALEPRGVAEDDALRSLQGLKSPGIGLAVADHYEEGRYAMKRLREVSEPAPKPLCAVLWGTVGRAIQAEGGRALLEKVAALFLGAYREETGTAKE
jgi:hypothetical protein